MINHTLNKQVAGNYEFLLTRLNQLDPTVRYTVKVTEYKSQRSIDQNSRLWSLYTDLGRYIGHSPDEVHQLMGYKFLRELKSINGEQYENIKSTTKLKVDEMTEYMEAIERFGADIGFVWSER